MPPCVQWTGTDNGGATARGVTADSVKIVSWLGQEDPATRQALSAAELQDPPAVVERAFNALNKYHNAYYQTYGREVKLVQMNASGESTNDAAMKADAIKIANEHKAFAVFAGNALAPIPTVLARELAQRGVHVHLHHVAVERVLQRAAAPRSSAGCPPSTSTPPTPPSTPPRSSPARRPASAGPAPPTRTGCSASCTSTACRTPSTPRALAAPGVFQRAFNRVGIRFKTTVTYLYDPGSNQNDITTMVAKLKSEGCTTIVPLVDPIQPILITKEATKQVYFPEWFIVGTGLSDTSSIGRFYDQEQWRTPSASRRCGSPGTRSRTRPGTASTTTPCPGRRKGDEGVLINIYRGGFQLVFQGIHMAGPNLNNQTFAQGLYSMPRIGGTPASPLVYFTRQFPTGIKDFSEVWWDRNRVGPDERSRNGPGQMVRADGGRRYTLGQWPGGEPEPGQRRHRHRPAGREDAPAPGRPLHQALPQLRLTRGARAVTPRP